MIGDFILFLKRVFKQHIFCIHHYKRHNVGDYIYYECDKCCRLRKYEP
jgi:hypothetical protein